MLEAIHYVAGAVGVVISLEVAQFKIMLETRSTAEKAEQKTDRNGEEIAELEEDIEGMATTLIRHTDAEYPVADGGEQQAGREITYREESAQRTVSDAE